MAFGYRLLRLWARTLRFEVDDRAGLVNQPAGDPFILAFWHNRLLLWPYVTRRFLSSYHGSALVSPSGDGELMTDFAEHFGFDVVRGSSSRRGVTALLQLVAVLSRGQIVVISPDGPRGPAYEIASGIVYLAQKSGAPVLPFNMEYSSFWRLRSWDRFFLPRPFSTVRLTIGPLHRVAATNNKVEFESERMRLQNAMMQSVKML